MKSITEVPFDFTCLECDYEVSATMEDVMDVGTPICEECGNDMILRGEQDFDYLVEKDIIDSSPYGN